MATESLIMFIAMQRFSTKDALRAILSMSSLVYLTGESDCSMRGDMGGWDKGLLVMCVVVDVDYEVKE